MSEKILVLLFSLSLLLIAACGEQPPVQKAAIEEREQKAELAGAAKPIASNASLLAGGHGAQQGQRAATLGYIGSDGCVDCHQGEFELWQQSDHYKAMEQATDNTVVADFNNTEFDYFGTKSRFYKKDGKFIVDTDNAAGEIESFEISHTFGFYPLQQFLIPFPDGRYQALNVVWDARPKSEGGQRWFHLYPDDEVPAGDILHWTGAYQNWNSRCATCHSTQLDKNYDAANNAYQTRWSEMNVGCEACHGPALGHRQWLAADKPAAAAAGFAQSLSKAGVFVPSSDFHTASLAADAKSGPEAGEVNQIDRCAHCHARREQLADPRHAGQFLEAHQTRLLSRDLYYPDGQIRDEVYVYGSFMQSKMSQAGVVCSNCHEPHSYKLKLEGNGLCLQCHNGDVFDSEQHHHHPQQSEGAQCVNCHMPATTYMGVDDRRDHGFKIPRPDLHGETGSPDACSSCHQDKDANWAAAHSADWYGEQAHQRVDFGPVMARAWAGDHAVMPELAALAVDPAQSEFVRASLLQAMAELPLQQLSYEAAIAAVRSPEALMRIAGLRALATLPPERRTLLLPLLGDPVKAVRMELAPMLAQVPAEHFPEQVRPLLGELFAEYMAVQQFNADMPGAQLNLALMYSYMGEVNAADRAFRQALTLAPNFIPALLNFADFYRATDRDWRGLALLQQAVKLAPQQAPAHHALGLLLVRQQKLDEALPSLARAVDLQVENNRYSYVYAVALESAGKLQQAITVLQASLSLQPDNPELLNALAHYSDKAGLQAAAAQYRQQLQMLQPQGAR